MADEVDIPLVVLEHWALHNPPVDVLEDEKASTTVSATASASASASYYDTPVNCNSLSVGTLVEVSTDISDPLYGVIRWVGSDGLAGVELEEDNEHLPLELTDGMHKGTRYFNCSAGRALFVPLEQCQKDSRFQDGPQSLVEAPKMFGKVTILFTTNRLENIFPPENYSRENFQNIPKRTSHFPGRLTVFFFAVG